ncbi:MAG: diguanylate cyclase [Oscillospiraceae bacterium]|nr:diguanylate cyclase [Oscillospiraceae bacterium]
MKTHKMVKLRTKFIFMLATAILLVTAVGVLIGTMLYSSSIVSHYNKTAYHIAEAVSGYFTDEELKEYAELAFGSQNGSVQEEEIQEIIESDRYRELYHLIDSTRDSMDANDIFVCVVDMDLIYHYNAELDAKDMWNPLIYILDSYYDTEYQMLFGERSPIIAEYYDDVKYSYENGVHSENILKTGGTFDAAVSAIYPVVINGETTAFIGVEIPMTTLSTDVRDFILHLVGAAGIAAVILSILFTMSFVKNMIDPIKLVASEAENFLKHNNQISDKLETIQTHDEIQVLSESFLKLEKDINDYIKNLTKITAEKEHDHMTGLYNKGKFMSLLSENFGKPYSIAVFNMDVNNLKITNDTYGHEMGDLLLIKAATSLRMMESEKVTGFRMGGDEFMLIAIDYTREEALELKAQWEATVERLNQKNDNLPLVIACGMAYGQGDYDLNEMLGQADTLMYEDKKQKKKEQ